jgi:hypothetical protein
MRYALLGLAGAAAARTASLPGSAAHEARRLTTLAVINLTGASTLRTFDLANPVTQRTNRHKASSPFYFWIPGEYDLTPLSGQFHLGEPKLMILRWVAEQR